MFGPHFPRLINDDLARSAGCFCWLVHSIPEIFSLQLARGEARKSSRNLAPRSLSFCSPGSFVHNRYCLCELKLFVLRCEKGETEGVRNFRRGFSCVAHSLLITNSRHLNRPNKPRSPSCGLGDRSSLPEAITSYIAPLLLLHTVFLKTETGSVGATLEIFGSILITGLRVV